MSSPQTYEQKYVQDVYNKIADHFSQTRGYLWRGVKEFIDSIKPYSYIIEVGSGNAKNLERLRKWNPIACDFSKEFCRISNEKGIQSITGNNINLPFRSNLFDYVLSVAVIHHLSTHERRSQAVSELLRIIKPGGKLFIQVWAFEQPEDSKKKFLTRDELVPWHYETRFNREKDVENDNSKNNSNDIVLKRYYHLFNFKELEEIINTNGNVIILKSFYEMGNWGCIVQKN